VKFNYPTGGCESTPLFVRNIRGEWYMDDGVPSLADLHAANSQDPNRPHAHPIRTPAQGGKGADPGPYPITVGGNLTVPQALVRPPMMSSYAAIIYSVTSDPNLDPNTDAIGYALVPLVEPGKPNIPTLSEWGMITLVMLLILTGGLLIRRRTNRATVA